MEGKKVRTRKKGGQEERDEDKMKNAERNREQRKRKGEERKGMRDMDKRWWC